MSIEFIAFLGIGTIAMFAVMLSAKKLSCRKMKTLIIVIAAVVILAAGVAGAKLLCFVELGHFRGTSYYGAVFAVPSVIVLVAACVKVRPSDLLDLAAPAGCVMLATLKILCCISRCCYGMVLWFREDGTAIRFPSQIAELCNALVLMAVLLLLMRKETMRGKIYPMYMVLYGGTRFCLNLLRETTPFLLGLPAGNFWSLISIFIGGVWLLLTRRSQGDRNEKHTESIA